MGYKPLELRVVNWVDRVGRARRIVGIGVKPTTGRTVAGDSDNGATGRSRGSAIWMRSGRIHEARTESDEVTERVERKIKLGGLRSQKIDASRTSNRRVERSLVGANVMMGYGIAVSVGVSEPVEPNEKSVVGVAIIVVLTRVR